jgi:hypothetical protein
MPYTEKWRNEKAPYPIHHSNDSGYSLHLHLILSRAMDLHGRISRYELHHDLAASKGLAKA